MSGLPNSPVCLAVAAKLGSSQLCSYSTCTSTVLGRYYSIGRDHDLRYRSVLRLRCSGVSRYLPCGRSCLPVRAIYPVRGGLVGTVRRVPVRYCARVLGPISLTRGQGGGLDQVRSNWSGAASFQTSSMTFIDFYSVFNSSSTSRVLA
ncbi:unnamed protein product [Tuber aestivum]|uniref:Uncharacterized protein n=1 Tax=Tuber aestivum TaxID=59557 RepID=A0A292Q9A2_9PEZI|nr:unnamed protein product [Tuber aestivum]